MAFNFNPITGYQNRMNRWFSSSGLQPPTRRGQFASWQASSHRQWNTRVVGTSSVSHTFTGLDHFATTNGSQATANPPAASSDLADSSEGGYDYTFVEAPPDRLMCQICQAVARAPHQVTCCGRVYCKACLDKYKRRSSNCPNCRKRGQDFPDTRGDREIKSLKVVCSNSESGCDWVGELRSLDDHLTTCGHTLLRCTNECMENGEEVRMLRRDLDQHLKNKCPNRQYQCRHCKDTGRYRNITTTHLDTCPKVKVSCRNSECNISVLRCNLSKHRSKCPFEEVPCKYAGIGCEEELCRKDLEQHEKDDTFHLHLAIEAINEQQVKKRSCIFKMPEFCRHKSSGEDWCSPPFYTRPGGYKMCIRVNASGDDDEDDDDGDGDATGTHVSVYAYLMKGRNDDNLPWPFTGEVTITLLNQLEDINHYTKMVAFPHADDASRRVMTSDVASDGYGMPKFISHDKLAAKNYQYLKDDALFFQIEVQAAKPVKPWLTCTV